MKRHNFLICCPAHDDRKPSLSVRREGDKWLWHCHAGCSQQNVFEAMRNTSATWEQFLDSRPAAVSTTDKALDKRGAGERIAYILENSLPASDKHPYLVKKGVMSHGLRLYRGCLVIPLSDAKGNIQSLQFIDADGNKRFLSGGLKKGNYFMIGAPQGTICIAEGYATAASIYTATGYASAVAFDAGNLCHVGMALRTKYPKKKIIFCADDDADNPNNPGMAFALSAAHQIQGFIAIPEHRI